MVSVRNDGIRMRSMAKDDMRVIMYKIPEEYWKQIIAELSEAGYVKGFIYTMTKDGLAVTMTDSASITLAGVELLEENGSMAKVRQFLGSAFEIVLETILKA